ncbi:Uncharacterized protein HSR122_0353 [Halapricum desulfuricans]|uniref:PKD domain-containing protein n=2 Tax=Halapricum desulfuricans TaxID=2841257 RepID=A0A897N587_9EURY|nr:Uncharacterized protein HSR122_0353 [Halapricum desulfuricans]
MKFSRRRYLVAASLAMAGCSGCGSPRTDDEPFDPNHTVAEGGSGDYETLVEAYEVADTGDVIGVGDGHYSLAPVVQTVGESPVGAFDTFEKTGLTIVGRSTDRTSLSFGSEQNILAMPSWQLWRLSIDSADTVVGPRANTFRACRIASPIMDPPGYGGPSHRFGENERLTTTGMPRRTSAEQTYHGLTFDRVLNGVEDLGFDPTGQEPIDALFENAYESGTLIELPPGEYRIESEHVGSTVSRFGLRGLGTSRRDVQIVPTSGMALKWLKAVGAGPHLLENLSFQERSDDKTQVSLWLTTSDGSVIKNVEWLGRTPPDKNIGYSLAAEVTEVDGVFVIDGIYAGLDEPATVVDYPNGVAFVRSGPTHEGEVILRNPVIHGRNSNATRSTAPTGVMTIQGGEFVNNQNTNIRFGAGDHPTKVSSATGSYVKVDGSRNSADAIRLNGGERVFSGAVFRDIHVEWTKDRGRAVIALPEFSSHGRTEFYDCVIHNDGQNTPTVKAAPTSISDDEVVFENCVFTGQGGGFITRDRPGSVIRNSCIDMPNASISGFKTENITNGDCALPKQPPSTTATITANKREGRSVTFTAMDSQGTIDSYRWDLDGETRTGRTITYTFDHAGTYTVTLTVEDTDGVTDSTTSELIVDYPELVR